MAEKLDRLLVTKLSPTVHEKLKELARFERRTLSAMNRIIIEDYIQGFEKKTKTDIKNR
jgi:predicted DNA-binding protein